MDSTHNKPVLAIRHHLQKYFKRLLADIKEIETKEAESKKEVDSLANLLEQMECVAKVGILCKTIATNFPDAKSKLLVKISAEVENKLGKLKNTLEPLKKHHAVVYKARTAAFNLIRKHPDILELHTWAIGEPTVPPLVVMLDWVDTVERQMREIYYLRVYYLENIFNHEIVNSENLVTLWAQGVPSLLDTVRDYQEQSIDFLQEKYV
ncbi:hypothetical protein BsWGS_15625 [Bradybaena similaris]